MELLYRLLAALANIIFVLVNQLFLLINNLSKYPFFGSDEVGSFMTTVYIAVGILMLFKLVISAIQYLVNPEQLSDKNKGLSSILTKSLIVVSLLVIVPSVFDYARSLQTTIVEQIPIIISSNVKKSNANIKTAGDDISLTIVKGFLEEKKGKTSNLKSSATKVDDIQALLLEGCNANFFSIDFWSGEKCVFSPLWFLIIPVGVYLVFLLLSMAIDIGIRTIKFGIVEVLAPIPIVSYINDEKKFNNWLKTSIKIYLDLFVRLALIFFVICLVDLLVINITANNFPQELSGISDTEKIFVKIAIIIALLLFAKNAPKFISDLLGLETDESIGNMFKRAGGLFGATTSGLRDTIAGGVNRYKKIKNDPNYKDHRGKKIASALKSAAMTGRSSMFAGTKAALSGKGYKDVKSTSKTAADRAYDLREARRDAHVGWLAYKKEIAKNRMGIRSTLEANNAEIKAAQESSDKSKAALDYIHNNISEKFGLVKYDAATLGRVQMSVKNDSLAGAYYDAARKEFDLGRDASGSAIKIDLKDSNVANNIVQLQSIKSDTTGKYSSENQARAGRLLDILQGEADVYIANHAQDESVVGKPNEAFLRILEEAQNTILVNSATQFGVNTKDTGLAKGISFDATGHVDASQLGDWLALNKKAGQKAQRENIRANADSQGAAAAAKQIADKYDKKGS